MSIQHITELYALDGREFVTEAYRNLLSREPDDQGMAYYLGRLAQGRGKDAVVAQLAKSPECRPYDQIKGLKQLIEDRRRAEHWFWRRFTIRSRIENTLQSCLFSFERLVERERFFTEQHVQMQKELSAMQDTLVQLTEIHQAKEALDKENDEILHNFLALQEEMEALILERRENESRLNRLEQHKSQIEEEKAALLSERDILRAQRDTLQKERDEQAWYAAERLVWLKDKHILKE
ncbi:DUF4214 domain-containing protein [Acidithiobacillus sp.]|uniref:DUF4214 domain-containing protein n=1 Tax=Acidithiobacillus sp. TaxID=1872118 RepID=UPI00262EB7F7|nr:DUF4214 domain-containing protein [Acidithiobacillus sp.]MDD5280389.1 DUF4214 domain-containing protein [Acidithiobacillus sp.]